MPLPPTFADFLGNRRTVDGLRAAIAAGRFPQSLILAGARGSGKYTLSLLLTMALLCEHQPREANPDPGKATPDIPAPPLAGFCGHCRHCTRIHEAENLEERVTASVAAREEMRDVDKRETRILIQTHPDVLVIPPDPPQLLIKLGQIRTVIARAQRVSTEGGAKVFLLTSSGMMKEAANSLLKVLEEPPHGVHIILLAENPGELLPTLRSRCALARLGALPDDELSTLLADRRPDSRAPDRALIARLSEGAPGRALAFDLDTYLAVRDDAFALLANAEGLGDHSALFRTTETYRAGAEGQAKTSSLLWALVRLLEDLLFLGTGLPERVRNTDRLRDLERLVPDFPPAAIAAAMRQVDAVYAGMRRNLLRSLSLDALALSLGATTADLST